MSLLPLLFFAFTYIGLALGRIPGLALDRTGFALLGAVAFLASGEITLDQAKEAIDAPTLAVLFGMMMLSAQYQTSGLYRFIGRKLAAMNNPRRLLAGTIVVAGALSAILTNDVVCFALTPLLGASLIQAGLKPLPFLIALACATNIGGALTPIGNPQNILISQRMGLPFLPFVLACAIPVVLSAIFLYALIARSVPNKNEWREAKMDPTQNPDLDLPAARKAILLTLATLALFLLPIPNYLTALGIAGAVLISRRMHTRAMLAQVDWQLLTLFIGLFVVVRGLELSGWVEAARKALADRGADLSRPVVYLPFVVVLSNLVGNVPAVMLLLPFLKMNAQTGHALALASTFAGNAILPGSIANLIVAEHAERLGIRFGFREHLRIGLPVTLVSLVIVWLAMILG